MAEFAVKTAQRKHAIWQNYDALSEGRCEWSSSGEKAGRSWSLEKLWSPFFCELIAKLTDRHFMHPVEVVMRGDDHRTARALTCIASVMANRLKRPSVDLLQTIVTELFLVGFSQTSHPRLANYMTFATIYSVLKLDKNWLQTKSAKTT